MTGRYENDVGRQTGARQTVRRGNRPLTIRSSDNVRTTVVNFNITYFLSGKRLGGF